MGGKNGRKRARAVYGWLGVVRKRNISLSLQIPSTVRLMAPIICHRHREAVMLVCLEVSASLSASFCLAVFVSVYVCMCLSVCVSVFQLVYVCICLSESV